MNAPSTPPVDPARRAVVDRAREAWTKRLIDLSRRNNLLFFRPLKRGTLDLTSAPAEGLRMLLTGEPVPIDQLRPDDDALDMAVVRGVEIERRALANPEERNLETLFFGFGLATWKSDDGGRPPDAPVLLLPAKVDRRVRS